MSGLSVCVCGCGHDGRLGTGNENNCGAPVPLRFFEEQGLNVRRIVVGGFHSFVMTDRGVYAFGLGENGQLGTGERSNAMTPRLVPFLESADRVIDIVCGSYHTIAWLRDGVFACGGNTHGQLGLGDFDDRRSFTRIDSLDPQHVEAVSCGTHHTLALLRDIAVDDQSGAVETGAEGSLEPLPRLRVAPQVLVSCGKGDFGELGRNADSWDVMRARERLLNAQLGARARHEAMGGDGAAFASELITQQAASGASGGEEQRRTVTFKRPPGQKKRRAAFDCPSFKPVHHLPHDSADPIVRIQAMHLHSAFTTACGITFHFGCYYDGEIEGEESSTPLPFRFRYIHCGDEVIFGWNDRSPLHAKGGGYRGGGAQVDEGWSVVPLVSSDSSCPAIRMVSGRSHFIVLLSDDDSDGSEERQRRAFVFGDNFMSQLGLGIDEAGESDYVETPKELSLPSLAIVDAQAGARHTVLLVKEAVQ